MEYDEIKVKFRNGNMIKSLKDGIVKKYSGYLTTSGSDTIPDCDKIVGYDSFNKDLIVYQDGVFAEVVEQGIDEYEAHSRHIENVLSTCDRLGCTPSQLLRKDYMKELSKK